MRAFISALYGLQNQLLKMGGSVETSIHSSIRCLVERRVGFLTAVDIAQHSVSLLNRPSLGPSSTLPAWAAPSN